MIIFIVIIFAGGIGITVGFDFLFDSFDIPHNQNFAENRIKRITEPLNWIDDKISGSP